MLGPFWCVESNGWLRFDTDNGVAELALIDDNPTFSAEEPILSTPWHEAGDGIFHVFLKDVNKHEYYCLKDQILYRLDGENTLTGLKAVSKYSNETWSRENKSRVFDGLIKSTTQPDADFKYPLTPEQQEALKKVKAMLAKEKWRAIQANDNLPIIIAGAMNNGLSEDQNTDLAHLLNNYFAASGFSAKNYETHEQYLAALRDLIISQENIHHEGLVNLAARTVDPIPSLEVLGDTQAINQLKKYFFFEILNEMYNYIRKQFGLAEEQLTLITAKLQHTDNSALADAPAVINAQDIEQAEDRKVIEDTEDLPSPIPHEHRFIKENLLEHLTTNFSVEQCQILIDQLADSLAEILSHNFDTIEDYLANLCAIVRDENNQYHQRIIALTFADDFNPENSEELRQEKYDLFLNILSLEIGESTSPIFENHSTVKDLQQEDTSESTTLGNGDGTVVEKPQTTIENKLMIIRFCMDKAQIKYQNWYDGQKPSPRGENGFFSWLRHGSYGQLRAKKLNDAIKRSDNAADAISKIDEFLTDRQTRYHRHSFASFMLDELKGIQDSHWSSVRLEDSNKYDPSSLNTPKIQA